MHFGSCFPSSVLGPVHAVGHKCDRRGIYCVDGAFKSSRQLWIAASRAKFFKTILQCCESFPEEGFHHLAVAVFVGMGKPVSAGRCSSPNRLEFCCMVTESIADIVETDRMGELTVKQTHNMAPC